MHIAHLEDEQSITVEQLAKMIGLKRRQVANLAKKGMIPGVSRPDGCHFQYRLTPELRDWIERKRGEVTRRRVCGQSVVPKSGKALTHGIIAIHGIRMEFDIWLRRVGGLEGILKMNRQSRDDVVGEIRAIADLYSRLTHELRDRG